MSAELVRFLKHPPHSCASRRLHTLHIRGHMPVRVLETSAEGHLHSWMAVLLPKTQPKAVPAPAAPEPAPKPAPQGKKGTCVIRCMICMVFYSQLLVPANDNGEHPTQPA